MDNIDPKIFYIVSGIIFLVLIYGVARIEQIWSHLKYQQQLKDIKQEALSELQNKKERI